MRKILFTILMSLAVTASASESAIIDPQLMNQDTWSEPVFGNPNEVSRDVASAKGAPVEVGPSQYVDIRKVIPSSEPSLPRSWVEHKILNGKD